MTGYERKDSWLYNNLVFQESGTKNLILESFIAKSFKRLKLIKSEQNSECQRSSVYSLFIADIELLS